MSQPASIIPVIPGPPSSLLDPEETASPSPLPSLPSDAPPSALASDVAFRHSGWWTTRQRILDALEDLRVPESRLTHFRKCGSAAWLARDPADPDHLTILARHCHDRLCLPCQLARSARILSNLLPHVRQRVVRFITLTIKHNDQPLTAQITRLFHCFGRLRRTPLWKARVRGGCYFLEVHRSADRTSWHPHLHIIAEGTYLAHSDLRNLWLSITTDSYIVDIRAIKDDRRIIRYVTQYVSKPLAHELTTDPTHLQEAITALATRRLCNCFGSWHDLKLLQPGPLINWQPIEPLFAIRARARAGDLEAAKLLDSLRRNVPCPRLPPVKSAPRPPPIP